MKKAKWNWLDTVILCIIIAVAVAAAIIFFGPKQSGEVVRENSDIYITLDSAKHVVGTYDALKVGDEILFGVIDKIELLPYETSVFNEETKQLEVYPNENLQICRFTVKTTGYSTSRKEVFVGSKQMRYTDEWNLETHSIRLTGTICDIQGGTANE